MKTYIRNGGGVSPGLNQQLRHLGVVAQHCQVQTGVPFLLEHVREQSVLGLASTETIERTGQEHFQSVT